MAVYFKSVLAGAAASVSSMVLFLAAIYLVGFIRLMHAISPDSSFADSHVTFTLFWPKVLATVAFIAGFAWKIRR